MNDSVHSGMDFPFLDADLRGLGRTARPVNVFELSGFPRWELVASNVLGFFLDPLERHGLGTTFIDGILKLAHGKPSVQRDGIEHARLFDAAECVGSEAWTVRTEFVTYDQSRIDLYLTNADLDLALVIENKVDASVNNPFKSYVERASGDFATVLCIVLAPTIRTIAAVDRRWLTRTVAYDDLFDAVAAAVEARRPLADTRSLTLLEQFIENLSERTQAMDNARDAATLDEYWSAIEGHESQVADFFRAIAKVNEILKARGKVLANEIGAALAPTGLVRESWFTLGMDHSWGRSDGRVTIAYVAFELESRNCIELMLGHHPNGGWKGMAIKGYPNRSRAGDVYADFDHIPLGLPWSASDSEIVAAFVAWVHRLETAHPRA